MNEYSDLGKSIWLLCKQHVCKTRLIAPIICIWYLFIRIKKNEMDKNAKIQIDPTITFTYVIFGSRA